MTPEPLIRPAVPGDLDGIVAVFLACWRGPYRGVVADEAIARWTEDAARAHWRRDVEADDATTLVAELDGRVAGVVRFGPDDSSAGHGYVRSLYVDPAVARAGVGRRLLGAADTKLAEAGFDAVRLWVFAANGPALRFYRQAGWQGDGRRRIEDGYGEPEIGLVRVLGPGREMSAEMAGQPVQLERFIARRPALIEAVRAAVPDAPQGVILLARGTSDNAAVHGRYLLELALGRPVSLAAPSLWTRYGMRQDLNGHVAIAVSQSGRTPEIATTLEALRGAGAATIAITNDDASPLAQAADATVDLDVGIERAVPATKTFTAQLAAFALLAEALGEPRWTEDDWRRLPDAQAAVLDDPGPAIEAAGVLAGTSATLHLARGLLYAVALESALKLAETAGLPSQGFSSADFLHGPVASAGPRTGTVAYIARGEVEADVREAAAAAAGTGAPLVVVGEEDAGVGLHVGVPAGIAEPLACLVHAIRAQQLAAHTTLALGRDPDSPRGLNKVTLTA